jgi:hypothetical protein
MSLLEQSSFQDAFFWFYFCNSQHNKNLIKSHLLIRTFGKFMSRWCLKFVFVPLFRNFLMFLNKKIGECLSKLQYFHISSSKSKASISIKTMTVVITKDASLLIRDLESSDLPCYLACITIISPHACFCLKYVTIQTLHWFRKHFFPIVHN